MTSINSQAPTSIGNDYTSSSNFKNTEGTFIDNDANMDALPPEDKAAIIAQFAANSLDIGTTEEAKEALDSLI